MGIHEWINTGGLVLTLILTGIIAWRSSSRLHTRDIATQERELAKLSVKVDTMWTFLLKRGVVEGTSHGLLSLNSPIRLTPESAEIMRGLEAELREFRKTDGKDYDEKELALQIERKFGDRIVQQVCIPHNISLGACLLIATAVAKASKTLTEILDERNQTPPPAPGGGANA